MFEDFNVKRELENKLEKCICDQCVLREIKYSLIMSLYSYMKLFDKEEQEVKIPVCAEYCFPKDWRENNMDSMLLSNLLANELLRESNEYEIYYLSDSAVSLLNSIIYQAERSISIEENEGITIRVEFVEDKNSDDEDNLPFFDAKDEAVVFVSVIEF